MNPGEAEKLIEAAGVAVNNMGVFIKKYEQLYNLCERERNELRTLNDRLKKTIKEKERDEKRIQAVESKERSEQVRFEGREDDMNELVSQLRSKLTRDLDTINSEKEKNRKENQLAERANDKIQILTTENQRLMDQITDLQTQISANKAQDESVLDGEKQSRVLAQKQRLEMEQEEHRINIAKMSLEIKVEHLQDIISAYKNYRRVAVANRCEETCADLKKAGNEIGDAENTKIPDIQGESYKVKLNF